MARKRPAAAVTVWAGSTGGACARAVVTTKGLGCGGSTALHAAEILTELIGRSWPGTPSPPSLWPTPWLTRPTLARLPAEVQAPRAVSVMTANKGCGRMEGSKRAGGLEPKVTFDPERVVAHQRVVEEPTGVRAGPVLDVVVVLEAVAARVRLAVVLAIGHGGLAGAPMVPGPRVHEATESQRCFAVGEGGGVRVTGGERASAVAR